MASVFSISLTEQPVRWLKSTALIYASSALAAAALFTAVAAISATFAPREIKPLKTVPVLTAPDSMPALPEKLITPTGTDGSRNEVVAQGRPASPEKVENPAAASTVHLAAIGLVQQNEIAGAKVFADGNNTFPIATVVGLRASGSQTRIVLRSATRELAIDPAELNWKRSADGTISATLPRDVTAGTKGLIGPATTGAGPDAK